MLLANFNRKEHVRHRAVSLRQHGFLVSSSSTPTYSADAQRGVCGDTQSTHPRFCKVTGRLIEDRLASKPKFCPQPRTRPQRLSSASALSILSSACPRTFYFGLVKMSAMMELLISASLQSTKVILRHWYKLVQVHVHGKLSSALIGLEDLSRPRPQRFVVVYTDCDVVLAPLLHTSSPTNCNVWWMQLPSFWLWQWLVQWPNATIRGPRHFFKWGPLWLKIISFSTRILQYA